jgi:RNA polymerase sigma factor (sigma-70 family)
MTHRPDAPSPDDLTLLSRVLDMVAKMSHLSPEDASDFVQSVHLHLLETDYELLRRFRGKSSLQTYLSVVLRRRLLDWRCRHYGRWRPSAAARRLGPEAIDLERLIHRDGCSREEAIAIVARRWPGPQADLWAIASALPARARRRRVPDTILENATARNESDPLEEQERRETRRKVTASLGRALNGLSAADRWLLRLRFQERRTIRSIADMLSAEPRLLYQRVERLLKALRASMPDVSRDEAIAVFQPADTCREAGRRARLGPTDS